MAATADILRQAPLLPFTISRARVSAGWCPSPAQTCSAVTRTGSQTLASAASSQARRANRQNVLTKADTTTLRLPPVAR